MKAQAFLILVGKMMMAQSNYYANRTQTNLIAAKELEKQVWAVLKQNRLEPDGPAATTIAGAEEERQLRLHLEDERDAGEPERDLDLYDE